MVSMNIMWQPPSIRDLIYSLYASFSSMYDVLRKEGSSTLGEREQVRLVGPTAPATSFHYPVYCVDRSASILANRALS
jgi:hypothetical protein